MQTATLGLALVLGAPFSILAAASAYLITYNEYQHHYADARQARRPALQAAVFALLVFLAISLIVAALVSRITSS